MIFWPLENSAQVFSWDIEGGRRGLFTFCLVIVYASQPCSHKSQGRQLLGGKQFSRSLWQKGPWQLCKTSLDRNIPWQTLLPSMSFEKNWKTRKPFGLRVPTGLMFKCQEWKSWSWDQKNPQWATANTYQPLIRSSSPSSLLHTQKNPKCGCQILLSVEEASVKPEAQLVAEDFVKWKQIWT